MSGPKAASSAYQGSLHQDSTSRGSDFVARLLQGSVFQSGGAALAGAAALAAAQASLGEVLQAAGLASALTPLLNATDLRAPQALATSVVGSFLHGSLYDVGALLNGPGMAASHYQGGGFLSGSVMGSAYNPGSLLDGVGVASSRYLGGGFHSSAPTNGVEPLVSAFRAGFYAGMHGVANLYNGGLTPNWSVYKVGFAVPAGNYKRALDILKVVQDVFSKNRNTTDLRDKLLKALEPAPDDKQRVTSAIRAETNGPAAVEAWRNRVIQAAEQAIPNPSERGISQWTINDRGRVVFSAQDMAVFKRLLESDVARSDANLRRFLESATTGNDHPRNITVAADGTPAIADRDFMFLGFIPISAQRGSFWGSVFNPLSVFNSMANAWFAEDGWSWSFVWRLGVAVGSIVTLNPFLGSFITAMIDHGGGRALGGMVEMVIGAVLVVVGILTIWAGGSGALLIVAGAAMLVHGLDTTIAGIRDMNDPTHEHQTFVAWAVTEVLVGCGVSEDVAREIGEWVDFLYPIVIGLGAGLLTGGGKAATECGVQVAARAGKTGEVLARAAKVFNAVEKFYAIEVAFTAGGAVYGYYSNPDDPWIGMSRGARAGLGIGMLVRAVGELGSMYALKNACFAAGTPLLTPEGSRSIEAFMPGDRILSRSEFDPEGPLAVQQVEEVFVRQAATLRLRVAGQEIRTTAQHPFWLQGRGWQPASEVKAGDGLLSHDGTWVSVDAVEETGEIETVYNLQISEYHTYFVGSDEWRFSVWAHNVTCSAAQLEALETELATLREQGVIRAGDGWMHDLKELDAVVTHLGKQSLLKRTNWEGAEALFKEYLTAVKYRLDKANSKFNVEWQPVSGSRGKRTWAEVIEDGQIKMNGDKVVYKKNTLIPDAAITEPTGIRPKELELKFGVETGVEPSQNPIRVAYDISYETRLKLEGTDWVPEKALRTVDYKNVAPTVRDLRFFRSAVSKEVGVFQVQDMQAGAIWGLQTHPQFPTNARLHPFLNPSNSQYGWGSLVDTQFLRGISGR
jgi:hypothetical protein